MPLLIDPAVIWSRFYCHFVICMDKWWTLLRCLNKDDFIYSFAITLSASPLYNAFQKAITWISLIRSAIEASYFGHISENDDSFILNVDAESRRGNRHDRGRGHDTMCSLSNLPWQVVRSLANVLKVQVISKRPGGSGMFATHRMRWWVHIYAADNPNYKAYWPTKLKLVVGSYSVANVQCRSDWPESVVIVSCPSVLYPLPSSLNTCDEPMVEFIKTLEKYGCLRRI